MWGFILIPARSDQAGLVLSTKIHFRLELNQKPLTSEDLHGFLSKLDTHYNHCDSPQNNLSVALGRTFISRWIKKIKEPGIKLKYYALPEWVDKK